MTTSSPMIIWVAGGFACIMLAAIYNGAETGMYCMSRLRLSVAAHNKRLSAQAIVNLLADKSNLLMTTLLGGNAAHFGACMCMVYLLIRLGSQDLNSVNIALRMVLWSAIVISPLFYILGEIVPRTVFQQRADRFMPRIARILVLSRWAFRVCGLLAANSRISEFITRRLSAQPSSAAVLGSRKEMYQLLQESAAEGGLTRTQVAMLESVHKLRTMTVASVMAPLIRVVMLEANARHDQIETVLKESAHARMPVFEADRRKVVGVVHLLDIIDAPMQTRVSEAMRPIVCVSPSAMILDALSKLQKERRRMAAIIDNNGRCIGIVTVKDLVEEIVGELSAW